MKCRVHILAGVAALSVARQGITQPDDPPAFEPNVTTLLLFESPYELTPRAERHYARRFQDETLRFVGWELTLDHPAPARRTSLPVDVVIFRSNGTVLARQTVEARIEPGSNASVLEQSWGWREAGRWPADHYHVELYVGRRNVASTSFTVFHVPSGAAIAYNGGLRQIDAGKFREAQLFFDEAIRLYPSFVEAYALRAASAGEIGQHADAIRYSNASIRLDPYYDKPYQIRGDALTALRQFDAALPDYAKALGLNPKSVQTYVNRASTYIEMERFDDAIVDASRALALDSRDPDAYQARAAARASKKELELAIADATRLVELRPVGASYALRGRMNYEIGNHARAHDDFERAVALGYVLNERNSQRLEDLRQEAANSRTR